MEVVQQPPSPPQWSADGQWWWDGAQWISRSAFVERQLPGFVPPAPPRYPVPPPGYSTAPGYWMQPSDITSTRSPGLRTLLVVVLALSTTLTGVLTLVGVIGETSPSNDTGTTGIVLLTAFAVMFATSVLALIGVATHASWSRVAAIVAGVVVSLSCLGLVLGIPIIISAALAPNLSGPRS